MAEAATRDIWAGFPGEANTGIYNWEDDNRFKAPPTWPEAVDIFKQEETVVSEIWEGQIELLREPVEEVNRTSLRERTQEIISNADEVLDEKTIDALSLAQTAVHKIRGGATKARKFFGNNERGRFRKSVAVGAVVGALALAANVASVEHDSDPGVNPLYRGAETGLVSHAKTPQRTREQTRTPHVAATTLQDGENPWTISEDQLEAHGIARPTVPQVASYDKRLLHLNRITPSKAKRLFAGARLLLPKVR